MADIYSFGMSALSQIPDAYWQTEKELPEYYTALDAGKVPVHRGYLVTDEDKIRRDTIMRVMCDLSLNYNAMSQRLGINFASHFERELEAVAGFEADGLVRRSPNGFDVTDTGRLFIRNIAMCFDNTLAPAGERKHSKTI
jgi:oxygen-independent coproporphyrinogen-3 oxidase